MAGAIYLNDYTILANLYQSVFQRKEMENKVAFIGHRQIFDESLKSRLYSAVEQQIKNGCKNFIVGTHGEFDKTALDVLRSLRKIYRDIKIEVVITSLAKIKPVIDHDEKYGDEVYAPYADVETIMFDIEEKHFKQRITLSNKHMIDCSTALICYVDTAYKYSSGAKTIYKYAKKKGLTIVNLF